MLNFSACGAKPVSLGPLDRYMNDGRQVYKRMVPQAYHKVAGLRAYQPAVWEVGRGTFDCLVRIGFPVQNIDESAFCVFVRGGREVPALVSRVQAPRLFEAIAHLSAAVLTGVRLHRFTTLFKAYECLVEGPDLHLSAVRHAISHPETVLSRPKTVASLQELFGGTRIDLGLAVHRRVFYRELGRLIIEVDKVIGETLGSNPLWWQEVPPGLRPALASHARWYGAAARHQE